MAQLALAPRGLLLVTGQTGSGKSTTLAAMISYRSRERPGHIVTIEDRSNSCTPTRRASSASGRSAPIALRSAWLCETRCVRRRTSFSSAIRDEESATAAVHFSETGHLVLSTLHATNASQTLERLFHFFSPERHAGVALQLSLNLISVLSQRLLPKRDGVGRVVAVEIMLTTPRVRELLRHADLDGVRSVMQSPAGIHEGMQTFDYAIYQLIQAGLVDQEAGMSAADSPNDLRLRLKGLL